MPHRVRTSVAVVVLAMSATALAACGDDSAATTTPPTTVARATTQPPEPATTSTTGTTQPPPPRSWAVVLPWDEVKGQLETLFPGLGASLEEMGLEEATVRAFVTLDEDGEPSDLAEGGEMVVIASLLFPFEGVVPVAMQLLEDIALYGIELGPSVEAVALEGLPEGAVAYTLAEDAFPRPVVAVAWPQGRVLHFIFAQGDGALEGVMQLAGSQDIPPPPEELVLPEE